MTMYRSPTRSHFVVAVVMLALCVILGSAANSAMRTAIAWLANDAPADARLRLSVRLGSHSLHVRNVSGDTWQGCVVTVDGGYSSPFSLPSQGVATIPYTLLASDRQPLRDGEGVGRALRSTSVSCADDQARREMAVLQ